MSENLPFLHTNTRNVRNKVGPFELFLQLPFTSVTSQWEEMQGGGAEEQLSGALCVCLISLKSRHMFGFASMGVHFLYLSGEIMNSFGKKKEGETENLSVVAAFQASNSSPPV